MNKAKPILLALAAALVITALIALGPLHRLDKLAQDQLFQQPGVTDTNILIIGIDEDALELKELKTMTGALKELQGLWDGGGESGAPLTVRFEGETEEMSL